MALLVLHEDYVILVQITIVNCFTVGVINKAISIRGIR